MASKRKIPIDKDEVAKWARAGATQAEIAGRMGVTLRTLCRRLQEKEYRDLIPKAQAELKISLRSKQVQLALSGNPTMLIWLGKQMLGQTDQSQVQHTGADGGAIEHRQIVVNFVQPSATLSTAADNRGLPASARLPLPPGSV